MRATLAQLPFFVVLMGLSAVAMIFPAAFGLYLEDFTEMRVFFYGFILFSFLTVVLGLATRNNNPRNPALSQLLTLVAAYALLPVMLAVPFYESVETTTLLAAWFEMVSSFTTTGATLFDGQTILSPALHLWRAMVGWMGGLLIWVAAFAIFAPMNLGGFEVRSLAEGRSNVVTGSATVGRHELEAESRLNRFLFLLAPIYVSLTAILWIGLMFLGEYPYVALCHAMSVLSTSGITPVDGLYFSASGFWGEALIFCFFAFAISRLAFSRGINGEDEGTWAEDPEFRMAAGLIVLATAFLFLRHFVGEIEGITAATPIETVQAFWGALFTVTSFLTTTGFESGYWDVATDWSRLDTPGLLLLGLALIGGGVATTAGGVKLLRVFALYRHGERELERLVHPSSIGGGGKEARNIRRKGAYISWIFFMMFAISVTVVMLLLSLTGVTFADAMVLAISALSTTGPLATIAAESPISYSEIPNLAKIVLAAAMVLGRLETLAIIALFNPEFWRK